MVGAPAVLCRDSRTCSYLTVMRDKMRRTSRPVRLGELRSVSLRLRWRVHKYNVPFLPLEGEPGPINIFANGVEFDVPLDRLESIARVKFSDQLRIVDTMNLVHGLIQNLPNRV